jgi:gliding motility-associated protein GldC
MKSRTAEIKLTIELDPDNLPTRIAWQASEGPREGPTPCQSMMLSLWDSESKTIAAIDLWSRDTTIEDMNLYFYQAIHRMADTYLRATRNSEVADSIHEFGNGFGDRVGLLSSR